MRPDIFTHSVITLNAFGYSSDELADVFLGFTQYLEDEGWDRWNLSVIEDVESDEPQDGDEVLDSIFAREAVGFEEFLSEFGLE